jgi:hypothetical protein
MKDGNIFAAVGVKEDRIISARIAGDPVPEYEAA